MNNLWFFFCKFSPYPLSLLGVFLSIQLACVGNISRYNSLRSSSTEFLFSSIL